MRRFLIPPMVSDLILTALQFCDGIIFDRCDACPACGGEVSGYDLRTRRFAVIRENGEEHIITVDVKRFVCLRCNRTFLCDAPFYPDTRGGSPVVDLCITFAAMMPYYRVSAFLEDLGIIVDRETVRSYALRGQSIATTDMFGIRIPVSVIHLASLAAAAGDGRGISGSDVLAACGYPSHWQKNAGKR